MRFDLFCPRLLAIGAALTCVADTSHSETRAPAPSTSFFVTSEGTGRGGNLGGLKGADAHCQNLAQRAGIGARTWHAYLSTSESETVPAIHARDRIGLGPWVNARGQFIARNDLELHETARTLRQISTAERKDENNISVDMALDEYGRKISGALGIGVLTGSQLDGTAYRVGRSMTCNNWTSDGQAVAQQGHLDRLGSGPNPGSWNSAESTKSCTRAGLEQSNNTGRLYCFAVR